MKEKMIYGSPLGPRVTSVSPATNFTLIITFTNKEKRIFDAKPLLSYPAFQPLHDISFFNKVTVDHGTITWPNDIDYCPDTLYLESKPF